MIGLFFEVEPKPGHMDTYLELAAGLREELDKNPGVVFLDRYMSLDREGVLLSHQFWRDEAHLVKWRANSKHYKIQVAGRNEHFSNYRLRIGARCAHLEDGGISSTALTSPYNDPAVTPERHVLSVYSKTEPRKSDHLERFRSVYREDEYLVLITPKPGDDKTSTMTGVVERQDAYDAAMFLISRDYGQHDREEAPQFMK